ncbi:type II secretion system ATPase GspE [Kiritimatiellaeota bacterium B1221]|nr:type II secretion system ATPase GspE [Kiritimatiellaeota bacterium B1221]
MTPKDEYTLETLRSAGLIDDAIAEKAAYLADEKGMDVTEVLEESGMITGEEITRAIAEHYGMEMVSLRDMDIDQEVVDAMPAEIAQRYGVVPVYKRGNELTVAISDPQDMDTLDSLRYTLSYDVVPIVASEREIKSSINLFYSAGMTRAGSALQELTEATISGIAADDTEALFGDAEDATEEDAPIIKLVSLIIIEAFRKRASDIHVEPMEKKLRVRYRIDGVLQEVESPPKRLQSAILQRIKIMSNMKIAEKRVCQDGRIQINVMGRELDLRVSVVPTNHGESVVMRILDKESLRLGLPELGFFTDDQQTFRGLIQLADGIVLVTGPTGSGKTTTLYSCLNEINTPDRKIITVEDPVEYQLSGINQVHVRADIGLTFAAALRSILRQAPNIVMIGEIRDMETAEIAVNASLTGHLVFSTLHTNDAPSAVTRLIDIGVKPFLVASSLRGIMAQRLVRKICSKCAETYKPTDRELRSLGALAGQVEDVELTRGAGCQSCAYTGYSGRIGIFEIFLITEEVQHLIYDQVNSSELRSKARELGMRTLREDGLRKVIAGQTTLAEVFRATLGDLD